MTGTPARVGPVKPGDEMIAEIERIGTARRSARWRDDGGGAGVRRA